MGMKIFFTMGSYKVGPRSIHYTLLKYRSERTNQTENNNLNYLIDPKFTKVNRLFVLSFEIEDDRTSFLKYDIPNIETEDFNALIDSKIFLR